MAKTLRVLVDVGPSIGDGDDVVALSREDYLASLLTLDAQGIGLEQALTCCLQSTTSQSLLLDLACPRFALYLTERLDAWLQRRQSPHYFFGGVGAGWDGVAGVLGAGVLGVGAGEGGAGDGVSGMVAPSG